MIVDTVKAISKAHTKNLKSFILDLHPQIYDIVKIYDGKVSEKKSPQVVCQMLRRSNWGVVPEGLVGDIEDKLRPHKDANALRYTVIIRSHESTDHSAFVFWWPSSIPRIAIYLTKKFSPASLISQVRERFHFEARETIRRLGRDDGLEVTLSLTCPLSAKRMIIPVRAETCTHLTCFDGQTFFEQFATCIKSPKPLCPVCSRRIHFSRVRIDDYFVRALETSEGDVLKIYRATNGTWKEAKLSQPASSVPVVTIDDDGEAPMEDDSSEVTIIQKPQGSAWKSPASEKPGPSDQHQGPHRKDANPLPVGCSLRGYTAGPCQASSNQSRPTNCSSATSQKAESSSQLGLASCEEAWFLTTKPSWRPYCPQLGDSLVYLPLLHTMKINPGGAPHFERMKTWLRVKVNSIKFFEQPTPYASLDLMLDDPEVPNLLRRVFSFNFEPGSDSEWLVQAKISSAGRSGKPANESASGGVPVGRRGS